MPFLMWAVQLQDKHQADMEAVILHESSQSAAVGKHPIEVSFPLLSTATQPLALCKQSS